MHIASSSDAAPERAPVKASRTLALLEELLAHTIRLRDLYKSARRQTSDMPTSRLRLVFDDHYKEQIRLVDVLIDRLRMLGGVAHIFAGDLLQGTQISCGLRSQRARNRLFRELLDAHESILGAARPGGAGDGQGERSWVQEFAVGQVILSSELQSQSICELLVGRGNDPSLATLVALPSD
jgi:starvation-inducible DNA-binding protein